jgi:hypothetical protein
MPSRGAKFLNGTKTRPLKTQRISGCNQVRKSGRETVPRNG